ncbi:peptide ABC transporter substrate-binding protein [Deinococcus piscis]|uniref:Peptide ABC transporter substrate-binding protein n=2 Tax=Deinococcus piscis TaxID=394230 RepID=A0ABQ3K3Z8_9DEIO|nr:peptide ABC transporter substrate-binding protein [Deinococcus piscis]
MNSADIPTMDPAAMTDSASISVMKNVYETLLVYADDSVTSFEPVLATKWDTSADGLTYRFDLRPGVKFHSGNPLRCLDAEYTYERSMVTNSPSSSIWYLSEPLLGTQANAADDPSITWDRIDRAVECEGEQLVFTLPRPEPAFLERLTFAAQGIVDREHATGLGEWDGTEASWKDWVGRDLDESKLAEQPSGTGAYRVDSANATDITLLAFEDYWDGAPALKSVVRRLVPEQASRIQALLSGDADIAEPGSREVIETQLAGKPGIRIVDDLPSYEAAALHMNQNAEGSTNLGSGNWGDGVPPNFFADRDMRLCFVKAFDYVGYADAVLRGKGERRNVLLPPRFFGYDPSIPVPEMDLAAAETHCRAAHGGQAWEQGFTLNAAYREGSTTQQTSLEVLKQGLEAMNPKFKVNVVPKQWSDLISPSNIEVLRTGRWLAAFAESDNFYRTFYHPDGLYASYNHISTPELTRLVDEARYEPDDARQQELYSEIARLAQAEGLYVLLPVELGIEAYADTLRGIAPEDYNQLTGYFYKDLSKGETP